MAIFFEVETPNGIKVRTTYSYWEIIITHKYPSMMGKEDEVIKTLESPNQIRVS